MRTWVWSLASLKDPELPWVAMSWGVGHRHGLDPTLLWLWCRLAAAAPIQHPSLGTSICCGCSPKKTKKKKKKKKEKAFKLFLNVNFEKVKPPWSRLHSFIAYWKALSSYAHHAWPVLQQKLLGCSRTVISGLRDAPCRHQKQTNKKKRSRLGVPGSWGNELALLTG